MAERSFLPPSVRCFENFFMYCLKHGDSLDSLEAISQHRVEQNEPRWSMYILCGECGETFHNMNDIAKHVSTRNFRQRQSRIRGYHKETFNPFSSFQLLTRRPTRPKEQRETKLDTRKRTAQEERLSKAAKASEHISPYMRDQTFRNFQTHLEIVQEHMLETAAANVHCGPLKPTPLFPPVRQILTLTQTTPPQLPPQHPLSPSAIHGDLPVAPADNNPPDKAITVDSDVEIGDTAQPSQSIVSSQELAEIFDPLGSGQSPNAIQDLTSDLMASDDTIQPSQIPHYSHDSDFFTLLRQTALFSPTHESSLVTKPTPPADVHAVLTAQSSYTTHAVSPISPATTGTTDFSVLPAMSQTLLFTATNTTSATFTSTTNTITTSVVATPTTIVVPRRLSSSANRPIDRPHSLAPATITSSPDAPVEEISTPATTMTNEPVTTAIGSSSTMTLVYTTQSFVVSTLPTAITVVTPSPTFPTTIRTTSSNISAPSPLTDTVNTLPTATPHVVARHFIPVAPATPMTPPFGIHIRNMPPFLRTPPFMETSRVPSLITTPVFRAPMAPYPLRTATFRAFSMPTYHTTTVPPQINVELLRAQATSLVDHIKWLTRLLVATYKERPILPIVDELDRQERHTLMRSHFWPDGTPEEVDLIPLLRLLRPEYERFLDNFPK